MAKLQQNGQPWQQVIFDGPEDMLPLLKQYYGDMVVMDVDQLDTAAESNDKLNPAILLVTYMEWNDE